MKEIRFKCWVEDNGEKLYGPGPNELIKQIQQEGSLSKAASKMNMSYKKAWEMVQRLNEHCEEPLILLKKGGSHGGGAEVTERALEIVKEFDDFQNKIKEIVGQGKDLLKLLK